MLHPAILLHMIQIDESTGEGVTVSGCEDAATAERKGGIGVEIVVVFRVENAVGEGLAGADTEEVAGKTGSVRVDIIQSRALLRGDSRAHRALLKNK